MKDGFIKVRCLSPEIKVGDVSFNTAKIIQSIWDSCEKGVKILVLPELCVSAYTCGDLFSFDVLISASEKAVDDIREATTGKDIIVFVGAPLKHGSRLYNCAVAILNGKILGVVPKKSLPNHSEFYELRTFYAPDGSESEINILGKNYPFGNDILFRCENLRNLVIGAEICEDLWTPTTPSQALCSMGANVIVNLSASNETVSKDDYRRLLCQSKSGSLICAYLFANAPESESTTDLIFSAHNIICENGAILAESKPFEKKDGDIITEIDIDKLVFNRRKMNTFNSANPPKARIIDFNLNVEETTITRKIESHPFIPSDITELEKRCEMILTMQSHALAKRLEASGAKCAVIGISGGLDSTLSLLATVMAFDYLKRDRKDVVAVTMPCFGTTKRTKSNATTLCSELGISFREIDIFNAVRVHFNDIGHDENERNVTYENAQARERTQILMDVANDLGGLVVGTGDLSEIALGWCTFNADHMCMYNVNASIPKTLIRHIVAYFAEKSEEKIKNVLKDILSTPVSPELLPPDGDNIAQKTEDLVGPYDLHDFFLYNMISQGYPPSKILRLAKIAFNGTFDEKTIEKWLTTFVKRFFSQQFKRSCSPDGVKVGSVALSPRGDLKMPSDASSWVWLEDLERDK